MNRSIVFLASVGCVLFVTIGIRADHTAAGGAKTVADYRYFRALSIDFAGRPPLRDEIAAYEQPGFSVDKWLDQRLTGPEYAERITRIYLDLLRLEIPPQVQFHPAATDLQMTKVMDPSGRMVTLYFRQAQRRANAAIDGQVCFTEDESGLRVPHSAAAVGTPKPIAKAVFEARTVLVKPWWLYADYRAKDPQDRASPDWVQRFGGFELMLQLFVEPDKAPMEAVRVCREEAQTADTGRVLVTGRTNDKGPPPPGRSRRLPPDSRFAIANPGKLVSCTDDIGVQNSAECGCGIGLERCLPTGPAGFMMPTETPLGAREPFQKTARPAHMWLRTWWTEEASHFIARIFEDDRDVRELLTSRATTINGPLALFYRTMANATCCGATGDLFGYTTPDPLFDPKAVPPNIVVQDTTTWVTVADRGPHAAGVMTMPIFLLKYGTRRQRAHAVYTAFVCKDFVANNVKLQASQESDLTKRPGCATCHTRLEPLSAYFTRIQEGSWTYLPAQNFPLSLDRCKFANPKQMNGGCNVYYDPAFTTASHTVLRGAYSSAANAEAGPQGLAKEITSSPEFAPCVVKNVAQSLLGRPLSTDDEAWRADMAKTFVDSGYRMRALVRAIVTSPAYRDVNDQRGP
jgi:hypothetical protein